MQMGTGETDAMKSLGANEGSDASFLVNHVVKSDQRHASSAEAGSPIVITPVIHAWFGSAEAASTASAAPADTPDTVTGAFNKSRVRRYAAIRP